MKLTEAGRRDALLSFVMRELELHLFTSIKDESPKELDAVGYKTIVIDKSDWTLSRKDNIAKSSPKAFVFAEPFAHKIGGFYLTRPDDDDVLYVERFSDGPYDILRPGESIKICIVMEN